MAAIEFKSSAQTSFDDVAKLRQLAQEQGASALTNLTGAVKTVGDDYTKQNDAQVQAMINAQTYDQSQDPEQQALLQQKIQDFSKEKHGMVNLGTLETARDNRGVTLEARKADQDRNTAYLMQQEHEANMRPHLLKTAEVSSGSAQIKLAEDLRIEQGNQAAEALKTNTYMYKGLTAALAGTDPTKNPEGHAAAKKDLETFVGGLNYTPGQWYMLKEAATDMDTKQLIQDMEIISKDLKNKNLASTIDARDTLAAHQVTNDGVKNDIAFATIEAKQQGQYAAAEGKEETVQRASDAASATSSGYQANTIKGGKVDGNYASRQLTSNMANATALIGFGEKNHTNFNDFARTTKIENLSETQRTDIFKALQGQKLTEHERIAVWDAISRGEIPSLQKFIAGGTRFRDYQGTFEKDIKEYVKTYNKETMPRLEGDAKRKVLLAHTNLYTNAEGSGIAQLITDLGLDKGKFPASDYKYLPQVVKDAVGMADDRYERRELNIKHIKRIDAAKGDLPYSQLIEMENESPGAFKLMMEKYPNAYAKYNKTKTKLADGEAKKKAAQEKLAKGEKELNSNGNGGGYQDQRNKPTVITPKKPATKPKPKPKDKDKSKTKSKSSGFYRGTGYDDAMNKAAAKKKAEEERRRKQNLKNKEKKKNK